MKTTQRAKILAYCKTHGSITARDAYVELDINSPRKRISELRRSGFNVETITECRVNSHGIETRYNRYFITEAVQQ